MINQIIIPMILCFVFIILSIPLILQKVRPNCFYGVRTRKTMPDEAVWYKANKFFGCGMLISSLFSLVVLIVVVLIPDVVSVIIINKLGGLVVVLPVGVLVIISFFYFRKL
jgi:uncharacterized membrane protein